MKRLQKAKNRKAAWMLICCIVTSFLLGGFEHNDFIFASTGEHTVVIDSVEKFQEFVQKCALDTYSAGKNVLLESDLDFSEIEFTAVPYFQGNFDGQGHRITGITLKTAGSNQGLFRYIGADGVVQNLAVSGDMNPGGSGNQVGGIVGNNQGTIINSTFSGNVSGNNQVGGIAGVNGISGKISNCTVSVTVTGAHEVGGIAGINGGTLSNCENQGEINTALPKTGGTSGTLVTAGNIFAAASEEEQEESSEISLEEAVVDILDIGGIAGRSSGIIESCRNIGAVGYQNTGYNVGGIAGRQSGILSDCINEAAILGRKDVGGITGQLAPYTKTELTELDMSNVQNAVDEYTSLIDRTMDDIGNYSDSLYQVLSSALQSSQSAMEEMENQWQQSIENQQNSLNDFKNKLEASATDALRDFITADNFSENSTMASVDTESFIQDFVEIFSQMNEAYVSSSYDEAIQQDMMNLSNQMGEIIAAFTGSVNDTVEDLSNDGDKVQDVSDGEEQTAGIIKNSTNIGEVIAETNVGGIIGNISVDLSYDLEDSFSISSLMNSAGKYVIYAAVKDCNNYADIQAGKGAVGGIVGRMEYGSITGCVSGGIMTGNGNYVGGIAGFSAGMVNQCGSRVNLSGENYVGGITGFGHNITNNLAYSYIDDAEELYGSIAGSGDGTISGNYFVENLTAGIDNISYAGIAEPLTYDEMLQKENVPDIFREIKVTFEVEGNVLQEVEVSFGGSISEFPQVPEKDGKYWVWEEFSGEHIYYSQTITGEYHNPITTLVTEESFPEFLVEGQFDNTQELQAEKVTLSNDDRERLELDGEKAPKYQAYQIRVSDYEGELKIHKKGEFTGKLYLKDKDGWNETDYEVDGSYIVFGGSNGAVFVMIEKKGVSAVLLIVAVGIAALGFAAVKKGRKHIHSRK